MEVVEINEKFFTLPEEKRLAIINAGYKVFSQNSYKKSPMSEIAYAANISKSLLFYYFRNKKELYLFLLNKSAETTVEYLQKFKCYEESGFFEIMLCGLRAKVHMMKKYPDLATFALKAYYEKDPDVSGEIQSIIEKYGAFSANANIMLINQESFVPDIDIKMMYQNMYWASEGYLFQKLQSGKLDVDEMERDFVNMIKFWKKIYLK